ncbi:hypothetical protein ACSFA3_02080 [Variovorax sp. RHLX14]|uniref:hypothetical protein n=1 Tax=Variovorax sp. RHLX14 TaxID=1259731 RepID=UPI003F488EC6
MGNIGISLLLRSQAYRIGISRTDISRSKSGRSGFYRNSNSSTISPHCFLLP